MKLNWGYVMEFEWDPEKARRNHTKHKVTFEEAVTVFYDPLSATFDDPHHSIGERRLITIGLSSTGRLLVVSHTEKGKALRIISARSATAQERKRHEN
ncbi:MAG: BrnT family toxin [Desulfobacterales bacterium]|nr:BrnT family toxin [Desulfobacterales bacterium]